MQDCSHLLFILLVCCIHYRSVNASGSCPTTESEYAISYKLVKKNAKSEDASIITRRWFSRVENCMELAESKQALAFNFGRSASSRNRTSEANCVLLRCPEMDGVKRLINETGVDYYSAYNVLNNSKVSENVSVSCIETVGLFSIFRDRQNFSEAQETCKKVPGFLADVTSDLRTRSLVSLFGNFSMMRVGLFNVGPQRFWRNELDQPLSCFDYRAWDSGEPSHSRGCVGLFRQPDSGRNDPVWRVTNCAIRMPFICELRHQV